MSCQGLNRYGQILMPWKSSKELNQFDIDNLNKELIEMGETIQHANLVDNKGINLNDNQNDNGNENNYEDIHIITTNTTSDLNQKVNNDNTDKSNTNSNIN